MEEFRLSELAPFNACTVVQVEEIGAARLAELGIAKGAVLTRLFCAPCGEPRAFAVRGSVFALRLCDAELVTVRAVRRP